MIIAGESYFKNIPPDVLSGLANGVYLGTEIFQNVKLQEPRLFGSLLAKDIGTRLYSKSIQLAIVDALSGKWAEVKNLGFGQHIAQIRGDNFLIHVCYTKDVTALPSKSQYKIENARGNPDSPQLCFFSPPIAKTYESLYYILAVSSVEGTSVARLLLPDENFETSVDHLVLDTSALSTDDVAALNTERKAPELARGVLEAYGLTKTEA